VAIMTIRDKNQVTLPAALLKQVGLYPGAPVEFKVLSEGGIGVYPYGASERRQTMWDVANRWAEQYPEIENIDLELPPRTVEEPREIEW